MYFRADCEDLAVSCKKTKRAFDSLRKAHVPQEEHEALKQKFEDQATESITLKGNLEATLASRKDLSEQVEQMRLRMTALERTLNDKEVNLTVKSKMLEEQGMYLANMRTKLQNTEKELSEVKVTLRKREDVLNKVLDEDRELRAAMVGSRMIKLS